MVASISAIFGLKIPPRVIVPVTLELNESGLVNSEKTETINGGGILKPKMEDMEAAMYVKPSPIS